MPSFAKLVMSMTDAGSAQPRFFIGSDERLRMERELGLSTHALMERVMLEVRSSSPWVAREAHQPRAQAKPHAIAPISHYLVSVVALGASGALYVGVNVEFVGAAIGQVRHPPPCFSLLARSAPLARRAANPRRSRCTLNNF